ncbi:hypothetical protein KSP35_19425 [Aquihabitans sp. G128]|uniref:hypothetical protein n=1 Tax=Aquihabitans sp. G128 TaxID=2849779 RepID=UPI001C22654F|nr:hypothetical protein [Aquihabitans sp. G128]QXC60470.1 hypothetical protein KSP35_19425 [Aquihabitans sp. G128]
MAAGLLVAVGAVVIGGSSASGPAPGEALVTVHGVATVHRADGGTETVTDHTRLEPGDRFSIRSGSAELELADDVRFSAVDRSGDVPATELTMARVPTLRSGPLLVVAPHGTTLTSGSGEVRLTGSAAARVTRTSAVGVEVFRGRATLDTAGRTVAVPTLRAGEIVAAGELSGTRPVAYRASDAWDRRYLGPAISLDRQLTSLLRGMRADGVDGAALAQKVRARDDGSPSATRLQALLRSRSGALDSAVGVAIVGLAGDGSYVDRWTRAFRFHDAGAPWGLVAMDLGVDPDAVIDALGRAAQTTPSLADGAASDERAGTTIDPATGLPVAGGDGATAAGPGADGGAGGVDGGTDGSQPVATLPGGTPITIPGVTVPGATIPGVTVPVTLPGVTLPPVTVGTIPAVTTIVSGLDTVTGGLVTDLTGTVGTILAPITGPLTGSGGLLGPVTGSGGVLGGVTGSGGLLPLGP